MPRMTQYEAELEAVLDAAGNLVRAKISKAMYNAMSYNEAFKQALDELRAAVQRCEMTSQEER